MLAQTRNGIYTKPSDLASCHHHPYWSIARGSVPIYSPKSMFLILAQKAGR